MCRLDKRWCRIALGFWKSNVIVSGKTPTFILSEPSSVAVGSSVVGTRACRYMSAEASRVRINIFLPFRQDSSERLAHSVEHGRAPSPVIDKFRHLLGFFFLRSTLGLSCGRRRDVDFYLVPQIGSRITPWRPVDADRGGAAGCWHRPRFAAVVWSDVRAAQGQATAEGCVGSLIKRNGGSERSMDAQAIRIVRAHVQYRNVWAAMTLARSC